jgi:hypothetical protein
VDRATRYDAIIATLVGVLALLVSAYTAYIQRQQVRAQVFPIVQLTSGFSDEDVHLLLQNKGSGPALIRDVHIGMDGQPIRNWLELVERAKVKGQGHVSRGLDFSNFGRSVLGAGEQMRVLSLSCIKPPQHKPAKGDDPANPTPLASLEPPDEMCARLMALVRQLSISICYCSTLQDCFVMVDGPDRDAITTETRRCPAPSADSFN